MQINQHDKSGSMQTSHQTSPTNRHTQQAPSKIVMSVYAVLIMILVSGVVKIDAISYVTSYARSLNSSDGNFKLQWTYHNSSRRLFFKMTCGATFWCAVGFTTTDDGKNMENYDIAVVLFHPDGGVYIDVSCEIF